MEERKDADRLTPIEHARRIAALCTEKLATDVAILDMRAVCDYTDYFVIASGRNPRQTKSIHDDVYVDRLRLPRRRPPRVHAGDA